MAINIRPLKDRIVVKPLESEDKTTGGIILPDTAKEKPIQGEVVAVGPGKYIESKGDRVPPSLDQGDRVIFGKYAGTEVRIAGEEYKILEVKDVLAKLD
ncbi:MAG: co-chaperone GroES [Planctomycetota bacterium]|jgi:chaperonin GroES